MKTLVAVAILAMSPRSGEGEAGEIGAPQQGYQSCLIFRPEK
jgi:hypothetical protein